MSSSYTGKWRWSAWALLLLLLPISSRVLAQSCQSTTLASWSLDACQSLSNDPSSTSYSEFTPTYPANGGFSTVNASIVSRNSGSHSCAYPRAGASGKAMCVGASNANSFSDNSASAVRFSVTLNCAAGTTGSLANLNFWETAPTHYSWYGGASGTNNYPKKFGIRVLKNGVEVFKSADIATAQSWTNRNFDFSNNAAFSFTGSTVFSFELLPYQLVGNGASVAAWDLDDIKINGCCITNPTGVITFNQPANITVTASNGQSNAVVTYPTPTASSTCPVGNTSLVLVSGPASGSSFPIGNTPVCYRATDGCGNQVDRCFNVLVNAPAPAADCNTIQISGGNGTIQVTGANAPVVSVQVFNSSWNTVFNEFFTNSPATISVPNLPAGTYWVKVQNLTSAWAEICKKELSVNVTGNAQLPSASIGSITVNENVGNASINVNLSSPAIAPVSISYTTTNGSANAPSDYTSTSGTLTIPVGSSSGTILVPIVDDNTNEPTEAFTIALSSPSNTTILNGISTITINDNDAPAGGDCSSIQITANNGTITVTGANAPIVLVQAFDATWNTVYNQWFTNSPATITIPGLASGTYWVKVQNLTTGWTEICKKEMTVVVSGGTTLPTVSVGNITVAENAGNATLQVTLSNSSATPVTVNYSTNNGTAASPGDYTSATGTITIPAGSTSAVINIPITDDQVNEQTESFTLVISNPANGTIGTGTSTVTITDNDAPAGGDCTSIGITAAGNTIGLTGLNAPLVLVQAFDANWLQVFNQTYTNNPGTLTIPNLSGGQYFVKVQFLTSSWAEICKKEVFVQIAGAPSIPAITINSISIPENGGTATLTVSLSAPTSSPVTVQYATVNGTATAPTDFTSTSGTITIPAGSTSATLSVVISDDNQNEPTENFTVVLSNPVNATVTTGSGTITITDNDASTPGANCDLLAVTSGQGNITVSGVSAPIASVQVFNASWNTVFNQLYTNQPGTVNIPNLTAGIYYVKVDFYTSGWSSICQKQFTVTVTGGTPVGVLTFNQPSNITVTAAAGQNGATVTIPTPTASSTCTLGTVSVTQISGPTSGAVFAVGATQVCFRATDGCGNQVERCFTVTVNTTAPTGTLTFGQPSNITVTAAAGQNGATVAIPTPTASSTCTVGAVSVTQISGPVSGAVFAVGATQVCFRATDGCGNQVDRCFTVTVNAAPACTNSEIIKWNLDACSANSGGSNADFSEFKGIVYNVNVTNLSAGNFGVTGGTHSCTQGFSGAAACIGASAATSYAATDSKTAKFTFTVSPNSNGAFNLGKISFYEKAPTTYSWIGGSSGANKYPTKFAIRVLRNGAEIYRETELATARNWTLREFDLSAVAGNITAQTTFEVQLVAYSPISSSASVSAWDIDEIRVFGCGTGTNPNGNIGCLPKILFLCDGLNLNASDNLIKTKLELLGYIVDCVTAAGSGLHNLNGHGCVLVSSSVTDSHCGWLKSLVLPVISWKASLLNSLSMTSSYGNDSFWSWDNYHATIGGNSSGSSLFGWLFGGLWSSSSTTHHKLFNFGWGSHDISWSRPNIANCDFKTFKQYSSSDCRIFGYNKGKSMIGGFLAPHKRVGLSFGHNKLNDLNDTGWSLCLNAIKWATSCDDLPLIAQNQQALTIGAYKQNDATLVKWISTSGEDVVSYQVERSIDGQNFDPIKTVAGAGTKGVAMQFSATDENPEEGDNYYRLQLIGTDGKTSYSDVKKVTHFAYADFKLFPNPANSVVHVQMYPFEGQDVTIEITNQLGVLVKAIDFAQVSKTPVELDLSELNDGYYTITMISNGVRKAQRLVVSKI